MSIYCFEANNNTVVLNVGFRRGASLSLRLAQNGHAKHSKLKNIGLVKRSKWSYSLAIVYPRFSIYSRWQCSL